MHVCMYVCDSVCVCVMSFSMCLTFDLHAYIVHTLDYKPQTYMHTFCLCMFHASVSVCVCVHSSNGYQSTQFMGISLEFLCIQACKFWTSRTNVLKKRICMPGCTRILMRFPWIVLTDTHCCCELKLMPRTLGCTWIVLWWAQHKSAWSKLLGQCMYASQTRNT
jgi:hypothetical protein